MEADERDEFLGRGGVGVISLSTPGDDSPHTIPVSYGYDAPRRRSTSDSPSAPTAGRVTCATVPPRS